MSTYFKGQEVFGPPGPKGDPGIGIPAGGTEGQVLTKASAADYDTKWANSTATSGSGTYPVKAPIGTIVAWSGTREDVPTGWAVCDGTNGTPDLRGRSIFGAEGEWGQFRSNEIGSIGGELEHKLVYTEMPSHNHQYKIANFSDLSVVDNSGTHDGLIRTRVNSAVMTPRVTEYSGSSNAHNNMPPYHVLLFIMKIAPDETDGDGVSFEPDDSLELKDGVLSVKTPTQGILTQAEFDALPEEKQNKGLYVISDGESSESSSKIIYSTEERRVGIWIDNKPLYQKTYVYGPTKNGYMTIAQVSEISLDQYVFSETKYKSSTGAQYGLFKDVSVEVIDGVLKLWFGSAGVLVGGTVYFTVRYTKTTDSPEVTV